MLISKKYKSVLLISLLTINIAATIFIIAYLFVPLEGLSKSTILAFDSAENIQYILYIGLNDKDTYKQIIPTNEAKEIINNICAKHVEGYTASEAQGGWVDENNILTQENTLVYTFTDAVESKITAIMDEVLTALNQNAILVEKRSVNSTFYSGKD